MAVAYRPMAPAEEPAVLALWGEPAHQAARLASDPAARARILVAAAPGGSVLAALHWRVAPRRDAAGIPRPVGEVDSLTTRPEARRRGHATRLLLLAHEALRAAGCDWALLVATPAGRPLYERHGWRPQPEPWRRGEATGPPAEDDGLYRVRPFDPRREPDGWGRLAAVDAAFNRARPLAVARDAAYWGGYAAWRVAQWIDAEGLVVYGAFRPDAGGRLVGFALAEFYPPCFQVRDLAALPGEPGVVTALLAAVAAEARRRGIPPAGRLYLPREPAVDAALARLFGPTLRAGEDRGQLLTRPIAPGVTDADVAATLAAPGAHFSAIDLF